MAAGVLALVIAVFWTAGTGLSARRPRRRAEGHLQERRRPGAITAVVAGPRGRPVMGLLPSDFELDVSGERVQIVEFGSEATGISLAMLIDDSGSMSLVGRRDAAQEVARHIVSWLEAGGRGDAARVRQAPAQVQPFTSSRCRSCRGSGASAVRPHVDLRRDRGKPRAPLATRAAPAGRRGDHRRVDDASVMSPPSIPVASEIDVRSTWSGPRRRRSRRRSA